MALWTVFDDPHEPMDVLALSRREAVDVITRLVSALADEPTTAWPVLRVGDPDKAARRLAIVIQTAKRVPKDG